MLRRLLLAVVAVVAMTTASAVPANASCGPLVDSRKFWTSSVCMAIGDTGIEAPYLAQQWNIRAGWRIQAANNCVTAGYPPSRRFTIDTYYSANGPCWYILGPNGGTGPWWNYTNNPVLWMNLRCMAGYPGSIQARHYVSAGIGNIMGMGVLGSSGYNSRVMNMTDWSVLNVPVATTYDGSVGEMIYNGGCG
jgi:hypothetical protein